MTMALSTKFTTLVNKLQASPSDPMLKHDLLKCLPEMKALAKVNPWALFCLAQVYPQTSPQYLHMMTKSADSGCTNAMLAAAIVLLKSASSGDVKKAARYVQQIRQSNDSYIIGLGESLVENSPILAKELKNQARSNTEIKKSCGFFAKQTEKEVVDPVVAQQGLNA